MVGVPGRSKACHTCRQRRIRCDGGLPGCGNCTKARRICTGYQRNHAFVLSKEMVSADSDLNSLGDVMFCRWRVPHTAEPSKASDRGSPATNVRIPLEISGRNVFRDRLFSLFAENNLSPGDGIHFTFGQRNDWMLRIINLPNLRPALEDSLLSICAARLGHHASHPGLVRESLKLYAKGMSELRRDIHDVARRQDEQNLAACLALLLYEVAECPAGTSDGYLAHYRGTMELVRMRGPEAHTSGLSHSIFQILRIHSMFQGMVESKKPFLAESRWCQVPWSSAPEDKTPFDKLVDILLHLPDLTARRQPLDSLHDPRQVLDDALACVELGQTAESNLEAWFRDFKSTVPSTLFRPELSKMPGVADTPEEGKLFPVAFHFPSFLVGQNLVYYWIAEMSVHAHFGFTYSHLRRLVASLTALGRQNLPCTCDSSPGPGPGKLHCLRHFTMDMLPPLGHRTDWPRGAAYNICQSVEYFVQDETRGFGPGSMLPALALAKGYWKFWPGDWTREMAWVDGMLGRIWASGSNIAGAF